MGWIDRHRDVLESSLEPGERMLGAAGAIVAGRRRGKSNLPRRGFVLVVTDRRLIALAASTWLARPTGEVVTSWHRDEGAMLARAAFGRARLLLPDRTVVTLSPFGGWSLGRLTAQC